MEMASPAAEQWWPNFPPTPVSHRPTNPDVWRGRFCSHIREAIAHLDSESTEAVKSRSFQSELVDALGAYSDSVAADRDREYLQQIYSIASRAFMYVNTLSHPGVERAADQLRFDLAGLAGALEDFGADAVVDNG